MGRTHHARCRGARTRVLVQGGGRGVVDVQEASRRLHVLADDDMLVRWEVCGILSGCEELFGDCESRQSAAEAKRPSTGAFLVRYGTPHHSQRGVGAKGEEHPCR